MRMRNLRGFILGSVGARKDPGGLREGTGPVHPPEGTGNARRRDAERHTWSTAGARRVRNRGREPKQTEDQNDKERPKSESFGTGDVPSRGLVRLSGGRQ